MLSDLAERRLPSPLGRALPGPVVEPAGEVEAAAPVERAERPRPPVLGASATAAAPLRLGTRGSALALTQAARVIDRLAAETGRSATPTVIRTEGDIDKRSPLTVIGGRGVFTSALGDAVRAGEVDAAVHSAKDLPSESAPGLTLAAFPEREDPRDVLVSRHGLPLAALPARPIIGTSSRRRAAQVLLARPDARIVELRGNLDTRLRKALDPAAEPALDAVVLAAAGVRRMGWDERITELLPLDRFVPAPGQGALAIEVRGDDAATLALVAAIDDPEVAAAVRAERAFLRALGAGCTTPVGAHVAREDGRLRLRGMLAADDGATVAWADELLDADPATAAAQAAEIALGLLRRIGPTADRTRSFVVGAGSTGEPDAGAGGERERRPLAGKRVLVTRPASQAAPLVAALRERGAEPIELPTIRIAAAADPAPLDAALSRLSLCEAGYDWLVFTSANAVGQTVARAEQVGLAAGLMARVAVAAVGVATAEAVAGAGGVVALRPTRSDASGLLAALAEQPAGIAGRRILVPRGDLARAELVDGLRALGAVVDDPVAYRTLPVEAATVAPAVRTRLAAGRIDVATFASPSSVRNLAAMLGGSLAGLREARVVCVGATTAAAARAAGLTVGAVAEDASVAGLVAAVEAMYAPGGGRVVPGETGRGSGEGEIG